MVTRLRAPLARIMANMPLIRNNNNKGNGREESEATEIDSAREIKNEAPILLNNSIDSIGRREKGIKYKGKPLFIRK